MLNAKKCLFGGAFFVKILQIWIICSNFAPDFEKKNDE